MKYIEKMKSAITALVILCVLCAVAAFFLPNAHGLVFSYAAIILAVAVLVLSIAGVALLLHHTNRNATV